MKICNMCKEEKSVSEFYKSARNGYQIYCKTCSNKRRAQWARDNTNKTKEYELKYKYGLTAEQVSEMLEVQNGSCEICLEPFDGLSYKIDHSHTTGRVRGVLCHACNLRLSAYENEEAMEASLAYLAKYMGR